RVHRRLSSFPTRRSSDLGAGRVALDGFHAGPMTISRRTLRIQFDGFAKALKCRVQLFVHAQGEALESLGKAIELDPESATAYSQDRKSTRLNSSHSQISY